MPSAAKKADPTKKGPGRPPKRPPDSVRVETYYSRAEVAEIDTQCRRRGLSRAEYLRWLSLPQP